jgi:hypothetical protein
MKPAALRALADAADALARLAREVADDGAKRGDDALIPLAEATRLAATSVRVLREAIRARELPAFGRARDRSVRRDDLDLWIASRRVKPIAGADDADIARRVQRLARAKPAADAIRGSRRGVRSDTKPVVHVTTGARTRGSTSA